MALALRQALKDELGLTVSCGVARNRLLARLVGPLHKPDCATVLPDAGAVPFIRSQPLRHVPSLRCVDKITFCMIMSMLCALFQKVVPGWWAALPLQKACQSVRWRSQ